MIQPFNVAEPDKAIRPALQQKIDNLIKPQGSLGMLEQLALQIGWVQQSLNPVLTAPHHVVFAADHGIVDEGVSLSPKEVTWQQIFNFVAGWSGINFLCRQHGFKLEIVDAGVDFDFPDTLPIRREKIAKGTRNFLHQPAMTPDEMERCIAAGSRTVDHIAQTGCNIVAFGEMGIGNTSASSLWMHCFTQLPLQQCVGAGSGLDNNGIRHKYNILSKALDNYRGDGSDASILRNFGGYEMVMAVGAMCRAAERQMLILVDGFIMTACMLAATRLHPAVKNYAIFGHCGDETGHRLLLDYLEARPILHLGLRLGEGSGALCAYPIVDSAVRMINEMGSFADRNVTKYF